MSDKGFGKKFDKGAVKRVLDYLFGKEPDDAKGKYLDMRTDISDKEFFKTLTYYGILSEEYECNAAKSISCLLKRLAISNKRMGRLEGVTILQQQLPKKEVLLQGISERLEKMDEK